MRRAGGAEVGGERRAVGCVGGTTAARRGDGGLTVVCRALPAPRPKHALVGGAQTALHLAHARLEIALVAHVGKCLEEDFFLHRIHLELKCCTLLGERGVQLLPMRSTLLGKRGVDPAAHLAIPLLLPEVHPHEEAREGGEQRGDEEAEILRGDKELHGVPLPPSCSDALDLEFLWTSWLGDNEFLDQSVFLTGAETTLLESAASRYRL